MNGKAFSARLVILLIALAVFLFSLSVLLGAYEEPMTGTGSRAGAGAFSTSSVGYASLYDLLDNLGWRVKKAVGEEDYGSGDLLILAEPGNDLSPQLLRKIAMSAKQTLIVLPKWRATPDPSRSKWIRKVESAPISQVKALLAVISPIAWTRSSNWPKKWRVNEIGLEPTGKNQAQLVVSGALRPIVGTEQGVLVGEFKTGGRTLWVLADPDVMANHGLGDGDNAAFMLALLTRMGGAAPGTTIVFEEGVHGYASRPTTPLRLLFEFPFAVSTVLGLLAVLVVIWANSGRFGQPERPAPRLGFGKGNLIAGTARLMAYSGHQPAILRRYVRMRIRETAETLHAPPGLDDEALADWLDRYARAGVSGLSCREILTGLRAPLPGKGDEAGLMRCAGAVHLWRENILSACGINQNNQKGDRKWNSIKSAK